MSSLVRGNNRGTRAAPRGPSTRGRGRGRGALSSSSKFPIDNYRTSPLSSQTQNVPYNSRRKGAGQYQRNDRSNVQQAGSNIGTSKPSTPSPDPFEKERQENAAKRAQRGVEATKSSLRGRGTSTGRTSTTKRVHFPDTEVTSESPSPSSSFGSTFGAPNGISNGTSTMTSTSIFGSPATKSNTNESININPFGGAASSTPSPTGFNPFGAPSSEPKPAFGTATSFNGNNPFAKPPGSSSSGSGSIPFGAQSAQPSPFGSSNPSTSSVGGGSAKANPFAKPASPASPFGTSSLPPTNGTKSFTTNSALNPSANGFGQGFSNPASSAVLNAEPKISTDKWAVEIENFLRKQGIVAPKWPTKNPGDPSQKGAVEQYWQAYKGYRVKVRAALIKNGFLDDPDKPKKLSEAIDFKGTCEEMCPEFEKITRIMEHDVQGAEKALSPDGSTMWPSLPKMIKALARSAAGQDAPLPADVRSPVALKRTLDYLIDTILGDNELASVHGFLWDRTRAVRRDFVFQQQSMNSKEELLAEVYCLEHITRFHVIALHQMSRSEVVAEDFSEQQEVEQLGKALLSLIHAYEDCKGHGIICENEAEFRAYHIVFNGQYTGILEQVQDWGWELWESSDQIQSAVALVETMQNTWTPQGPLRPHAPTDIALNAYARFFSIVKDRNISYTMACFCEIHFTRIRKAVLKTILAAYRKQRDQTRDWTLKNLNTYLQFDDEEEIIPFCEAYGLRFEQSGDEEFLYLDVDDAIQDPFPPLKQTHSQSLVERKRGNRSLPDVIHQTVFEDEQDEEDEEEEESMFIPETKEPAAQSPKVPLFQGFGQQNHLVPSATPPPLFQSSTGSTSVLDIKPAASPSSPASSIFGSKPTTPPVTNFFGTPKSQEPQQTEVSDKKPKSPSFSSPGSQRGQSPFNFGQIAQPQPQSPQSVSEISKSSPQTSASAEPRPFSFPAVKPFAGFESPNTTPQSSKTTDQIKLPGLNQPSPVNQQTSVASPTPAFIPPPQKPASQTLEESASSPTSTPAPVSFASPLPASQPVSQPFSQPASSSTPLLPEPGLPEFAEWFALGKNGLVDHFIAYTVENILAKTFAQFEAEQLREQQDEEYRIACEVADQFRTRGLATKYGHRWRENARIMWLRRRGREGRQARRRMAENLRSSRASQSESLVADLRQSTQRSVSQELLKSTGVLSGVHSPDRDARRIMSDSTTSMDPPSNTIPMRRFRSSTRSQASSPDFVDFALSHSSVGSLRRSQSQSSHLRKSIMSDPALLAGGTRSHLFAGKWTPEEEKRKSVSGVKSDYFRLKARGITTLPDGSPLATSAAKQLLTRKSSYDSFDRPSTPPRPTRRSHVRSVPSKLSGARTSSARSSMDREEEFKRIKSQAQAYIVNDFESRTSQGTKRSFDDEEEEELFAKAKRVREAMDEGAMWYREESQKQSSTGSIQ